MRLFAVGVDPVGVVAIGQVPTGIVAFGQGATGIIAVGQLARGVVAIGQVSIGVFAFGQAAAGAAWAGGMLALGGTHSVTMLGYGPLGHWVPWRGRLPQIPPFTSPVATVARLLLFVALIIGAVYFVLLPVFDAVIGSDAIFGSSLLLR
jgi:hypothetical protein